MDSLTLAAVAAELRRQASGRLGPVVVPRREQMAVGLPAGAVLISIVPADPRVHLVPELPPGPRTAPGIQSHLDSLLSGGRIVAARVVDFDRILRLGIDSLDRVGTPRRYELVIELMGKHSACLVLEDGRIVATLKTVTRQLNRHRELLPGLDYVPPPAGGRSDPLRLTRAAFGAAWPELVAAPSLKAGWRGRWHGLSAPLWAHLCRTAGLDPETAGDPGPAARDGLWRAWRQVVEVVETDGWSPCLVRDEAGAPWLAYPLPLPGGEPLGSLSEGLCRVAEAAAGRAGSASLRGELKGRLKRRMAAVEADLKGVQKRLERAAEAAGWQLQADLLLANLHRLTPAATELRITDYPEPGAEQVIELDPKLTGPRNAELLYERARAARRTADGAEARRAELIAERARLADLRAAVESADDAELTALAAKLPATGAPPPPRTPRERALAKLTRRQSSDGYTILIGRNAAESEFLLSRIAAPSDLWLHVRGAGSGHVIVRTEGHPERVPSRTIEEAAVLAARQSKMRHSALVPVVYTERKHVTKVKGGQAGKVVYRHERTLFVSPG